MSDGWCPFAERRPTRNFGYPQGTHGLNRPVIFVDHIMAGWKRTLDDAGWREANGVGVHFGLGDDGSISQYTSIFDQSWGNGVSGSREKYDRSNRHLAALEREAGARWITVPYAGTTAFALVGNVGNLPNSFSISTEHEGFPQYPWPAAKVAASIRVKLWCLGEVRRVLGYAMEVDADVLVRHAQIDGVHRSRCPGEHWPKETILAGLREAAPTEEKGNEMYLVTCTDGRVFLVSGCEHGWWKQHLSPPAYAALSQSGIPMSPHKPTPETLNAGIMDRTAPGHLAALTPPAPSGLNLTGSQLAAIAAQIKVPAPAALSAADIAAIAEAVANEQAERQKE